MQDNSNYVYFFDVWYTFKDPNEDSHSFHIGYFSSKKRAVEAIEKIKDKPGFLDTDGNFAVSKVRVYSNQLNLKKENCNLFILNHEFLDEDGYDNYTIWGPFLTEAEATEVYNDNKEKNPYCLYLENFEITDQKADLIGWTEGFVMDDV